MGLLDDLEVPAGGMRRPGQEQKGFATQARGHMREAFMFFTDFVRTVSRKPPRVLASYRLEDFGELRELLQDTYQISSPLNIGDIKDFTLSCECKREGEKVVPTDGVRTLIEQRKEYLQKSGMRFEFEEMYKDVWGRSKGDRMQGAFHIQSFVPVSIRFEVDEAARRILLILRNFNKVGQERLPLQLSVMNEAFFNEVAKALLRRENQMNELAGFKVHEEMRAMLRARLQKEAMEKQQQLQDLQAGKKSHFFGGLLGRKKS